VWRYGVCAIRRFASRVQLELRLKAEPRTSKLNQKIRLKLLSAVFYRFFSLVFNFRCVFCGGLGGVVDAGGVLVGGCWVWLTAVAYLQHDEPAWR
jgi:hypothetical protein